MLYADLILNNYFGLFLYNGKHCIVLRLDKAFVSFFVCEYLISQDMDDPKGVKGNIGTLS